MSRVKEDYFMDYIWESTLYNPEQYIAKEVQIGKYTKDKVNILKTFYFKESPITTKEVIKFADLIHSLLYCRLTIKETGYSIYTIFRWEKNERVCKLVEIGMNIKNKRGYPLTIDSFYFREEPLTQKEYNKFSVLWEYILQI